MEEIKIKDGDFLEFLWSTEKWGRAEFVVCPQFKRGKLVKMFIYPSQQGISDKYYVWEGTADYFTVQSYQQLDDPKPWLFRWCKEHKTQSFRVYVPPESKYIWFSVLSTVTIGFTKTKW